MPVRAQEIEEEGARTLKGLAVSAGVMSVLGAGLGLLAWREGGMLWFFALVTGAVALGLVGAVVRQLLQHRKFGRSVLVLERAPVQLGEPLAARVRTGIPRGEAPPAVRLRLECLHLWEEESGMGEDRKTTRHRDRLWSDERQATAGYQAVAGGKVAVVVSVAFDLPADQPAARSDSSDAIVWELGIHVPLPGLDYRASFRLPVIGSASPPSEGRATAG
ncbi:MAG TPA: hypothetical protein VLT47_13205 [Anaeromyxobacteraceae bacterium]|nr:hypothetical protein [Anaeromyxobacteraceae bacterium]